MRPGAPPPMGTAPRTHSAPLPLGIPARDGALATAALAGPAALRRGALAPGTGERGAEDAHGGPAAESARA